MRVDPDSPLAEDLKKLKEKEGKDHILMSFMFKVGQNINLKIALKILHHITLVTSKISIESSN